MLDYSWVGPLIGRVPGLRKLYLASDPHDKARPVAWATGAALAIRKSAFQGIRGFDPSFFMYYEEVDLVPFASGGVGDAFHAGGRGDARRGRDTSQQRGPMYAQQIDAAMTASERHQSESGSC